MLLKSITLCCLMLNVQTLDPYFQRDLQFLSSSFVYPPDAIPVLPLSIPNLNELAQNTQRRIHQNDLPNKKQSPSVEIQKSVGSEFSSPDEPVPNNDKWNNFNRQISTPTPTFLSHVSPIRQTLPQKTQYAQKNPDISQKPEQNWPNIQQITLGVPSSSQMGQDRQRAPQRSQGGQSKPEISLSRPSVAVPQNSPDRPNVPQTQLNAMPSSSDFNFPTEQAPGSDSLLHSVTNFGINLLKTIDGVHSGNVVLSPFSITSLLALLQQGSTGQTQAQITSALHMSSDATPPAYASLSEDIRSRSRNSRNILRVVTNLFLSEDFFIDKNFRNVAINSFNSDVTSLSFQRAGAAARQINSWVASRTDNQIQNLIAPDALDYTTQIVLVNAIYFKGLWEVPFRVEATLSREFRLSNGQSKSVQSMRIRKMFRTGMDKTSNAKVIVLPFERDEYYFMVILPNELMGMRNTLASLTADKLREYLSFEALDTELELPKFTIRADTDLTVVLKSMGITNMFRRDYSELGGIGAYGSHSPTISSAVHSATLSIDEKGGVAAAATAFAAVALSYDDPSVEFKVNRPFIAVLWDNRSSLPLFMAKIEDPQQ